MSTPELKPETPITDAFFNRKPSGRPFLTEARETMTKLESALNAAREAIEFVLDECDWNRGDSDQPFGGGDERIGPALSAALAQINKAFSPQQSKTT